MMPAIDSQMSLFASRGRDAREEEPKTGDRFAMVLDHHGWLEFLVDEWWPLERTECVHLWIDRPRTIADYGSRICVIAWIDRRRLPIVDVLVRRHSQWIKISLSDLLPSDQELLWLGPIPLFAVASFSVSNEAESKRLIAMAKGFSNIGMPEQPVNVDSLDLRVSMSTEFPSLAWNNELRPPPHWNTVRGAAAMAFSTVPGMGPWLDVLCGALRPDIAPTLGDDVDASWWAEPPWVADKQQRAHPLWHATTQVILGCEERGWRAGELLEQIARQAIEYGAKQESIDNLLTETRAILQDEHPINLLRAAFDPVGLALQLVLLRPSPVRFIDWKRDLRSLPPGVWWTGATLAGALCGYKDLEPRFRGLYDARWRLALRTWQHLSPKMPSAWSWFSSSPSYLKDRGMFTLLWDDVVCAEKYENGRSSWLSTNLEHPATRTLALEIAKRHAPHCVERWWEITDSDILKQGNGQVADGYDKIHVTGTLRIALPTHATLIQTLSEAAFRYWITVGGIEVQLPSPPDRIAPPPRDAAQVVPSPTPPKSHLVPRESVPQPSMALVMAAQENVSWEISEGIPGLTLAANFVSEDEERALLAEIDRASWSNELARRVQHYGWRYNYKARTVDRGDHLGPLPGWVNWLAIRLHERGLVDELPDQVIVNEYLGKQGISKHIDCIPCFRGAISMISLNEAWEMNFWPPRGRKVSQLLERRSVAILKGPAREKWKHEIPSRKNEPWGLRGRRVSLTFRKVNQSAAKR